MYEVKHLWKLFNLDKTPAAECPVKDEPEYTKVFQRFFADGISLKKEIVKKIQG